jgi:hypothetical protein
VSKKPETWESGVPVAYTRWTPGCGIELCIGQDGVFTTVPLTPKDTARLISELAALLYTRIP